VLILFANKKLQKQCSSMKDAKKNWGARSGLLVMRRLDEISASNNLAILKLVHPRTHPLKGDRRGIWSLDLEHPYRLLFKIANDPVPKLNDGSIDLKNVTAVKIIGVEDTHGRRAKK